MTIPLRVLILEDNASDAELMTMALKGAGFDPQWDRVDSREDFLAKLDEKMDVILCDFRLPDIDAMHAMELVQKKGMDIPVIIVSGTIGEELAASMIRQGASDYVMKDRMGRLGQAVTQALERRQLRLEQKQTAEAMADSEERHRLLFESSPVPMWMYDHGTLRYLAVNEAMTRQYGYSREEFLSMTIKDIRPPEDVPKLLELMADLPSRHSGIFRHRKKDGALIDVEVISNWITIGGKQVRFGLSHNITDRKRAEEAQRRSEERFRATFEQAAVGIAHVSMEGRWLRVNQKLCDILGYSREEMLGRTLQSITNPENLESDGAFLAEFPSAETRSSVTEKRYLRGDGTWLWARATISLVKESAADLQYFITVIEDITEGKMAEQRILEQASLIDLANDAIIVRDMENRVQFWNQRAESMYGWSSAEVLGRSVTDMTYPNAAVFAASMRELLAHGSWSGEIFQVSKEGKNLIVDARWTLLRNEMGTPKSVLAINSDITAKKKLEEQFLRAQRLESIGTLASGVAHDLNNILAPILMSASMLREELPPEMQESIISTIEESAQRGSDIVKQVLTFARGVHGERLCLQPRHLIGEIEKMMQETFPKSITVVNNTAKDLSTVTGDPTQLHQVLLNLCINARDAMPRGGKLILSAKNMKAGEGDAFHFVNARSGDCVMIEITDTGTGIPSAIIDKIFDPFFTTKEPGKGTGLGLSTAMGIVKNHGGFLHVESEPDAGTTFKIYLPATYKEEPAPRECAPAVISAGKGELILAVDDEAEIRNILQTTLERSGYKVITASDGNEAMKIYALQAGMIKLVLTDVMMPRVDGVVLTRALKKINKNVRVIASTGQQDQARLEELQALGVKALLRKPYNREKLLSCIKAVLEGVEIEGGVFAA